MAITTQLVGKLGGDKFEVKTVTGVRAPATVSVPAGWKSCFVNYQGTCNGSYTIFGRSGVTSSSSNVGGGTTISGSQTASISYELDTGGTFTYIRTG